MFIHLCRISRFVLVLLFVLPVTRASAAKVGAVGVGAAGVQGFVGLYADPAGTDNCLTIAPGQAAQTYLVATLAGDAAAGFTAVELRIQGLPPGWIGVFAPEPSISLFLGDLFDEGVFLGLPICATGQGGKFLLGVATIIGTSNAPAILQVVGHEPPLFELPCPQFTLCPPSFSKSCMRECVAGPTTGVAGAFTTFINDPTCAGDPCASAAVEVALDIRPGSCPNPLNVRGSGRVPVAIAGAADVDVSRIDVSKLRLNGVAPEKASVDDETDAIAETECNCSARGADGIPDLVLKFAAAELAASLGPVTHDSSAVLRLTGSFDDGTSLRGQDCVRVVGRGAPPSQGGGGDIANAPALHVQWGRVKKLYR